MTSMKTKLETLEGTAINLGQQLEKEDARFGMLQKIIIGL
jgi:hypothetical protein